MIGLLQAGSLSVFRVDRPDLSTLDIVTPQRFTASFDPTIPIFIETDGACIVRQGDRAIEAFGPNASNTNNEMELEAIAEALDFIPNATCYVVVESDSESCLKVVLGAGEVWMANNYINLKGDRVKNKGFVDRICLRLRSLHAEFRKVKGHNNDQSNDRAGALAVMGRDDAISWPKCPFDVITAEGRIRFRLRSTRPMWTISFSNLCPRLRRGHWRTQR
jgi:ribonuclease HI